MVEAFLFGRTHVKIIMGDCVTGRVLYEDDQGGRDWIPIHCFSNKQLKDWSKVQREDAVSVMLKNGRIIA